MITKKDIGVFLVVFIIGTVLGTIGTVSFPIGANMSYFWPAAVVQAVGGFFFGIWGAVAATLFPSLSNALTDGSMTHVVGLIPANFIQSFIPLIVKSKLTSNDNLSDKKLMVWFVIGCVVVPNLIGGIVGCSTLYFAGDLLTQADFLKTLKVWIIGNIPCSIVFGILFLKILWPILKDCNLYYKGYLK